MGEIMGCSDAVTNCLREYKMEIKSINLRARLPGFKFHFLLLLSVILGKFLLNLFLLPFPHLLNRNNNVINLIGLL